MNNTLEEQQVPFVADTTTHWIRRAFQAPHGAPWVPEAFAQLSGLPALPAMRALRQEPDGQWSVEEYHVAGQLGLTEFLTQSAASVWVFVSIIQQCMAGLMGLHQKGFRHGAISPEAVRLNSAGHVTLSGCGGGEPWQNPAATSGSAPSLPHKHVLEDLRNLGCAFRAVLGGDAMQSLAATRLDIAPLVAEWIDWLAEPERGHEPVDAAQAASIFNDIRAGRPGIRPWKHQYDLPPQVGHASATAASSGESADLFRANKQEDVRHGAGFEMRPYVIMAAVLVVLLGAGSWLMGKFIKDDITPQEALTYTVENRKLDALQLPDEAPGIFDMSAGDSEPLMGTGALIIELFNILGKQGMSPSWPELDEEEKLRVLEAAVVAKGEKLPPRNNSAYLNEAQIFPAIGQPTAGRTQGDYYIAWRTQNFVMTNGELRAVQSAILRTARYCGVRIMAWTVLPNQAGVVLRVPPRRIIPDDSIERRVAILRGEKTAEGVISQINARLKAGDDEGADKIRRTWIASMGTAAGFFSVLRTVPVVGAEVLSGRPLWQDKPMRFSQLMPKTGDLVQAATALDTAAVKGKLTGAAHEWPYSSLTASMLNYGPAMRAVSVLMQKDAQMDLPVPHKDELVEALTNYRRHLGDLPAQPAATELTDAKIPQKPVTNPATPVATRAAGGNQ